jgi:hypothetical protein
MLSSLSVGDLYRVLSSLKCASCGPCYVLTLANCLRSCAYTLKDCVSLWNMSISEAHAVFSVLSKIEAVTLRSCGAGGPDELIGAHDARHFTPSYWEYGRAGN